MFFLVLTIADLTFLSRVIRGAKAKGSRAVRVGQGKCKRKRGRTTLSVRIRKRGGRSVRVQISPGVCDRGQLRGRFRGTERRLMGIVSKRGGSLSRVGASLSLMATLSSFPFSIS